MSLATQNFISIIRNNLDSFVSKETGLEFFERSVFRVFNGSEGSSHLAESRLFKNVWVDYVSGIFVVSTSRLFDHELVNLEEILQDLPREWPIFWKSKKKVDMNYEQECKWLRGDQSSSPTLAEEYGLSYQLDVGKGLDIGLHLDTSLVRKWLCDFSQGRRILNLFSYTCSFALAAMKGGAFDCINVDSSKKSLARGMENYKVNRLKVDHRSFQCLDVKKYLRKNKKQKFDTIIIDPSPPPGGLGEVKEQMDYYLFWLRLALPLLKKEGKIILSHHLKHIDDELFLKHLLSTPLKLHSKIPYPKNYGQSQSKAFVLNFDSCS